MQTNNRVLLKQLIIIGSAVFITAYAIYHIAFFNEIINRFFSVLTPFFIGFAIAYILHRPIDFIHEHVVKRQSLAILSVYILLIVAIASFSAFVLPSVVDNSISLATEISKGVVVLVDMVQNAELGPLRTIIESNISSIAETLTGISNMIVTNLSTIFITITSTFMNIFFGLIISIYMLLDRQKILGLLRRVIVVLFDRDRGRAILQHLKEANLVFSHFISGLLVEAIVVGVLAFIGFTILDVRYAVILALIILFTNVIPYVGPFIGAIPAVTSTLLYDPIKAIWVLAFIIVLQQIDANVIGPRIMGNYIGLDPIWIILSIAIGGGFFGVLGVLLAIPTGALIKITLSRMLKQYDNQREHV